jgi:hypothetical protein
MLGILFKLYLSFSQRRRTWTHGRKHVPSVLFISLCIHAFLEGFPVSHHQDLAVGIAIHHLPIAIILTTFLLIRICTKAIFGFMLHLCINDSIGTLASDFLPILNDYYRNHSPCHRDIISYFFHYHF